jgi:ribosomal protein S18 acetylase RimI-like enzyme
MAAPWRFLAEPPPIPGLVLRGFSGEEDFPEMRRVKLAAEAADGVDQPVTLEDFAVVYRHLQNCDPATDMVLAEIDGDLVAYGRVTWWEEYAGARRYTPFCFLAPEGRGRSLGTAMLAHGEARLREIAAGHPADGERTFEVQHNDAEAGAAALYAAAGYSPVLHGADMVRPNLEDIPNAPLPDGLIVRPPRDGEVRKVWDAEVEAFQDHLGAAPPGEEGFREMLDSPYHDPSLWRVGWDGDEVAGQVRSFINAPENEAMGRRRGYTENISVRRPYRRRGLARALLVQSLHAVRERGMEEAALGVLTENLHGAFRLYESVGFRVVRSWTTLRKPLD